MKLAFVCRCVLSGAMLSVATGVFAAPQPTGTASGVQASSTAQLTPYRINPGDEIEVYVWGEERLQRTIRVLPDGSFSFPLVGRLTGAGKLPSEVEADVSAGLAAQFRDRVPQVTVSVRTLAGFQVSVIGKVRSPGSFNPGKYLNVLEAIGIAGGPSEFADTGNVLILRKEGRQLVPIRVRLNGVLRGAPSASDLKTDGVPVLQSGDTVIVP